MSRIKLLIDKLARQHDLSDAELLALITLKEENTSALLAPPTKSAANITATPCISAD